MTPIHEGWDGSARLATFAINSSGFIPMGSTDPKRVLTSNSTFTFTDNYQIASGRIDISRTRLPSTCRMRAP